MHVRSWVSLLSAMLQCPQESSCTWCTREGETKSPLPRSSTEGVGGREGGSEWANNVAGVKPEVLQQSLEFPTWMTRSYGEPSHQIGLGLLAYLKITCHQGGHKTLQPEEFEKYLKIESTVSVINWVWRVCEIVKDDLEFSGLNWFYLFPLL